MGGLLAKMFGASRVYAQRWASNSEALIGWSPVPGGFGCERSAMQEAASRSGGQEDVLGREGEQMVKLRFEKKEMQESRCCWSSKQIVRAASYRDHRASDSQVTIPVNEVGYTVC
jgi:hypothetical protein